MGGFDPNTNNIVQFLPTMLGGLFSTPAYWQGLLNGVQNMIYAVGVRDRSRCSSSRTGKSTLPFASISQIFFEFPGASPVISANGQTGGIVWAIDSSAYNVPEPAILYAFDATNLSRELYDSNVFAANDNPGAAVKFTNPTVANGKVYLGTQTAVGFPAFGNPSDSAADDASNADRHCHSDAHAYRHSDADSNSNRHSHANPDHQRDSDAHAYRHADADHHSYANANVATYAGSQFDQRLVPRRCYFPAARLPCRASAASRRR